MSCLAALVCPPVYAHPAAAHASVIHQTTVLILEPPPVLQSCVNHSCNPNAAATCDQGNHTVAIVAQRDIRAGEEVTLSYIDESLPYKQRQAELRDYGFVCRCDKCVADAAAARARRQGAAKGTKVGKRR